MKKKYYKEINKISFSFVFDNSPVELIDATNYYDIETFEYALVLRMKNVSPKKISSLRIKLHLFLDNLTVPYKKIDYTYIFSKRDDEMLGETDYILIPQSFYKSFDVIIKEVVFEDGTKEEYNLSSRRRGEFIREQSGDIITACELVEESELLKEEYPAILIPKFGEKAWICSCSHKNSNDRDECEVCRREKRWLMEAYSTENLRKVLKEEGNGTLTMAKRAEKAEFIKKRDYKPIDESKELIIEVEREKVEKRERYKDKMRIQALPRFVLYFVGAFLIYFLVCLLTGQI